MVWSLAGITPSILPGSMTLIRPDKPSASKKTFSSIDYFDWPATIIGKVIEVTWNLLPAADFALLDNLYASDGSYVFDPGTGKSYTVQVTSGAGCVGYGCVGESTSRFLSSSQRSRT